MTTDTVPLVAGRELDALVAQRVMGHQNSNKPTIAELETILAQESHPGDLEILPNGEVRCIPRYSTSIAAAWTVVEQFNGEVKLVTLARGGWYCRIEQHEPSVLRPMAHFVEEKADTAPLAICLAALKVVQ